ncbi:hypothetical protein [Neptunicella sp. SCSIO 80796]|uniref:hypothetical protein n=1 Tax=Neptunicella plasticusilytica TaxID=3117012 RepID=UPI003A4DA9CA
MAGKTHNKVVLFTAQKSRGWDSLHAASLCFGCPKPRRYRWSASGTLPTLVLSSDFTFPKKRGFVEWPNMDVRTRPMLYTDVTFGHFDIKAGVLFGSRKFVSRSTFTPGILPCALGPH